MTFMVGGRIGSRSTFPAIASLKDLMVVGQVRFIGWTVNFRVSIISIQWFKCMHNPRNKIRILFCKQKAAPNTILSSDREDEVR